MKKLIQIVVLLCACMTASAAKPPPLLYTFYTTNTTFDVNRWVTNIATNMAVIWGGGGGLSQAQVVALITNATVMQATNSQYAMLSTNVVTGIAVTNSVLWASGIGSDIVSGDSPYGSGRFHINANGDYFSSAGSMRIGPLSYFTNGISLPGGGLTISSTAGGITNLGSYMQPYTPALKFFVGNDASFGSTVYANQISATNDITVTAGGINLSSITGGITNLGSYRQTYTPGAVFLIGPDAQFQGAIYGSNGMRVAGSTANTNWLVVDSAGEHATNTSGQHIDLQNGQLTVSGNVGIGTNNPQASLHIHSATSPYAVQVSGLGGSNLLTVSTNGEARVRSILTVGSAIGSATPAYLYLSDYKSSSGVGRGQIFFNTPSSGYCVFGPQSRNADNTWLFASQSGLGQDWSLPGPPFFLRIAGTLMVDTNVIATNGFVIPTANSIPTAAGISNSGWRIWNDGTNLNHTISLDGTNLFTPLVLGTSGNVGIGTNSPQASLHIHSATTPYAVQVSGLGASNLFAVETNGAISVGSQGGSSAGSAAIKLPNNNGLAWPANTFQVYCNNARGALNVNQNSLSFPNTSGNGTGFYSVDAGTSYFANMANSSTLNRAVTNGLINNFTQGASNYMILETCADRQRGTWRITGVNSSSSTNDAGTSTNWPVVIEACSGKQPMTNITCLTNGGVNVGGNLAVSTQMEPTQPIACYGALMMNSTNLNAFGNAYTNVTGFDVIATNQFTSSGTTGYLTNKVPGFYRATVNASFIGINNGAYEGCLLTNGVDAEIISWKKTFDAAARMDCMSAHGIIYLPAGTACSFGIKEATGAGSVAIHRASIVIGTP